MLREGTKLFSSSIMREEDFRAECYIIRAQARVYNWDWD